MGNTMIEIDLQNRKRKLVEIFIQVLNFLICLTSTTYEGMGLSRILHILDKKPYTYTIVDIPFILYVGTLFSFFINEQVFEPLYKHKITHHTIIGASVVGCVVSIIGATIETSIYSQLSYDKYVWVMFGLKFIVVLAFAINTFSYVIKIAFLWNDKSTDLKKCVEAADCNFYSDLSVNFYK